MNESTTFLIDHSDSSIVSAVISEQFPQFSHLPVRYAATGWDNVMFHLGNSLAVRLPRRPQALQPLSTEVQWLNSVTARLTVPHPRIEFVGKPSQAIPYPWTIVHWVEGRRSMSVAPEKRRLAARELGHQLALLHSPAPHEAPINPFRGTPLQDRNENIKERLASHPDLASLMPLWQQAVHAPHFPGANVWCHGDIHPGNYLLHEDGSLAGIVDFGDLTQGDPAVDLGAAWSSFDADGRAIFLDAYFENCLPTISQDPHLLTRARGWVIASTISAVLVSDLSTPDFVDMAYWAQKQLLGK